MEQLHLLSSALRDSQTGARVTAAWLAQDASATPIRYFDPYLQDTLALAGSARYVEQTSGGRIRLAAAGLAAARSIEGEAGLFVEERARLASLQPLNTNEMWRRLGRITKPNRPGE
jgi:hypothetical protein